MLQLSSSLKLIVQVGHSLSHEYHCYCQHCRITSTLSRTVFIPACERSVCVDLVTHEDTIVENEKLDVFLQVGPALDPSVHVDGHIQITIIDDDSE